MLDFVKRIFARRRVTPEIQPDIRHVRFGNVTVGVNIHAPEEFLKIATVWRCTNLVANAIATLPWHVMRKDARGHSTRVVGHDIEGLLNSAPNREMTPFQFRRTLMHHVQLYGNGYAEIEQDGAGRAVALWPIAPDRVEPWRDERGNLFYRVAQPRGGVAEIEPFDIFHVPGPSWDGIRGYSMIEVGMQSLGGAYAMDRFAGRFFGRGMLPSGVVEVPEGVDLDPEGMERLRKEFEDKHQGWASAQGPLILDQGMKFTASATEPDKGQFLDTRKFSVYDVCRWFGVPPYLAFASDEEPRANVETQSREFLMYGLDPHIISLEQEANRKLFFGFRPHLESRMDVNEFLRGDLKARGEYYKTMREMGVFSINDILRMEGRDPIGPEGDVRVMQVQFQPIGPDGAPMAPTTEAGDAGEAGDALPMNGLLKPRANGDARVNGHAPTDADH